MKTAATHYRKWSEVITEAAYYCKWYEVINADFIHNYDRILSEVITETAYYRKWSEVKTAAAHYRVGGGCRVV